MANDIKNIPANKRTENRRDAQRTKSDRRGMVRWEPKKTDRRETAGRRAGDKVWGNPKFKR